MVCIRPIAAASITLVLAIMAVWLVGLTIACIVAGVIALVNQDVVALMVFLFFMVGWIGDFVMLAYMHWTLRSVTTITFGQVDLLVDRRSLVFRRRHSIPRNTVTAVRQTRQSSQPDGPSPIWNLVVDAGKAIRVAANNSVETRESLGSMIAKWAAVPFEK
jgi:hypothetical protein